MEHLLFNKVGYMNPEDIEILLFITLSTMCMLPSTEPALLIRWIAVHLLVWIVQGFISVVQKNISSARFVKAQMPEFATLLFYLIMDFQEAEMQMFLLNNIPLSWMQRGIICTLQIKF